MEKFSTVSDLFNHIFIQLESKNIEYMVSGSYALNVYTVPRMTRDIDLVVNLNLRNLENFLSVFSEGYYCNRTAIIEDLKNQRLFNIIHDELSFKLDFIPKKRTELAEAEFKTRKFEKVLDTHAWVISPEHLFIAKLIWIQNTGSDFHLRDLNNLLFFPGMDKKYIALWCHRLSLKTFGMSL